MSQRVVFLLLFLPVALSSQGIITFTARNAQTSAPVILDSIYILHEGTLRDTTLKGVTEFRLNAPTGVASLHTGSLPLELSVPSPTLFDAKATFTLRLEDRSDIAVGVYSILGKRVAQWSGSLAPGTSTFELDGASLASGVYIIVAMNSTNAVHRKVLKLTAGRRGLTGVALLNQSQARFTTTEKSSLDRWTFIGYAKGFFSDTLLSVEAEVGKEYGFLMTPQPSGMRIQTGRLHQVLTSVVPVSGGKVTVSNPVSPLKGFTITVPDSSHDAQRAYELSYAEIIGHDLGADVRILSPLIRVKNGGGYADRLIEVHLPVQIPADEFAMAFLYNERTGEIEGLPLLDEDANGLTVVTRHFATSTIQRAGFGKRSAGDWADAVGNLFVASVKETFLSGQTMITTGFSPGKDDWEFPNYGSYIAPKGHCAGQSMTAMWYYYEKRLQNQPQLYHRYDRMNTHRDTLWTDNPRGYKLASVVQEDMRWDDWLRKLLVGLGDSARHAWGYHALMTAMILTGEPQYMKLTSATGGHAVVCYGINVTKGKLLIADPNFPATEQTITFSNEYFTPYLTKQNANDPEAKPYPLIGYIAKTSMIEWNRITGRWKEFEDGTIGTVAPNTFPAVTYKTPEGDDFPDVYEIRADTLTGGFYQIAGAQQNVFKVWNDKLSTCNVTGGFVLLPETHEYGVEIYGEKDNNWCFVDFRWLRVNSIRPEITRIRGGSTWGDEIVIEGKGFGDDKTKGKVDIDAVPMRDVRSWADTAIRVVIPEGAQPGYVVVRVEKASSKPMWFAVTIPASVSSIEPDHGYRGDRITLRGSGLKNVVFVLFNGTKSDDWRGNSPGWTDSVITATVPNGCMGGPITLSVFGNPVNEDIVTGKIFTQDSLVITSIDPVSGPMNTVVNIHGERFGRNWPGSSVFIGGQPAGMVLNWTDDRIAVYGSQSGRITVTVCGVTVEGPMFTMTP